jgi:hypothetical protein
MNERRAFNPYQLAERWECSPAHVRNLCRRGDLRHFRIGKEYRIPVEIVEGIEACEEKTSGSSSTEEAGTQSGETADRPSGARFVPKIVAKLNRG